jgi:hypothetical protein
MLLLRRRKRKAAKTTPNSDKSPASAGLLYGCGRFHGKGMHGIE